MQYVIKVIKAIPWVAFGRFSFKLVKFLGMAAFAFLVFSFKIYAALAAAKGAKPEVDEDDDDIFYIGWSCPAAVKPRFGTVHPPK